MNDRVRRELCQSGLRLIVGTAFLRYAASARAVTGSLKWAVRPWLQRLDAASAALSAGTLAPASWQAEMEAVLSQIELRTEAYAKYGRA